MAAGVRTKALSINSRREKKNGSALGSRFSFLASPVLEPQVRCDLQNARVVRAEGLTKRAGSEGGANVLGIDVQILEFLVLARQARS